MTRDPFDRMTNSNPVPPDMFPSAPMSMADRIVGARAGGWPAWALTAVTAIAVLVVGLGSVWLFGGEGGDEVAGGDTTTTTATATTVTDTTVTPTTAYLTTTTIPIDLDHAGVVYFLGDGVSDIAQSGPYLLPVARPVDEPDTVSGTLAALFDGPTAGEASSVPAISSAIPSGTTLLGAAFDGSTIVINLSSEFQDLQGSFGTIAGVAQVVFTLTRFDEIDSVRFEIDGAPTTVFGSQGLELIGDIDREDFYPGIDHAWDDGPQTGLIPAVLIESPAYSSFDTGNPLVVSGVANVFEATVSLALTDDDGLIIWEGFTNASCGTGCWGEWGVDIPYEVDQPQMGALIAWESSAMDGSQINVREHPVWLVPSGSVEVGSTTTTLAGEACSGALVTDTLIEQAGLSPQDTAMRSQIFYAARECDWDALRSLQIEGFRYSFGENEDAVTYWQQLEAAGEQPIRYLAELLNRPYGTQPSADENLQYFVWPSAFVTEWSQVSEKERDELRPLYDDEDFAGFAGFGAYIGYRVGVIDGSWVFFVAGD
jgi:hypothetical protein